jgi:hypothetical protein
VQPDRDPTSNEAIIDAEIVTDESPEDPGNE